MTVQTDTEKSVLTYSKCRGIVTLVIGTEPQLDIFNLIPHGWTINFLFFKKLNIFLSCSSLLHRSFHETEENGSERLHSEAGHQLLRLQAVSTVWLVLLFRVHWNQEQKLQYQLLHLLRNFMA